MSQKLDYDGDDLGDDDGAFDVPRDREPLDFGVDEVHEDDVDTKAYMKKARRGVTAAAKTHRPVGRPRKVETKKKDTKAPVPGPDAVPSSSSDEYVQRHGATLADQIRIITALKKKPYAVGTGLVPGPGRSLKQHDDEIDLLLSEIHGARGYQFIAKGFKEHLIPAVQAGIMMVAPERCDVGSHFTLVEEVNENWDDMFKDAVDELAILYGHWFTVSAPAEVLKATIFSIDSCRKKNAMLKARQAAEAATPVPTPLNRAQEVAGPDEAQ